MSSTGDKSVLMHRVIMNINSIDNQCDHFNRNKKDNRKKNLRVIDQQHNNWNKGLQLNNFSGVTGVRWNKKAKRWVAYIGRKHLGSFKNIEDAIKIRKKAEKDYFGDWSYDNNKERRTK